MKLKTLLNIICYFKKTKGTKILTIFRPLIIYDIHIELYIHLYKKYYKDNEVFKEIKKISLNRFKNNKNVLILLNISKK
jgi:hypothetical protein